MTRFSQGFLRDRLGGRTFLAAFGKHPAWNDHVGLIGARTETLALLEDVLYRQGIAGQLAAGSWHDPARGVKTPAFNHRFVWSRAGQSAVGALWPSTDGKGRGQFPFVCCVQSEVRGTAAVQLYLEYAATVGEQARGAPTQLEVQSILERGGRDLNREKPTVPTAAPLTFLSEQAQVARDALLSLAQAAVRSNPARPPAVADGPDTPLRLPSLTDQLPIKLWFYAGFLEQFSPAPPIYLLISSVEPGAPVDCVLEQPGSNAFFCLGADLTGLPITTPPASTAVPEHWHQNADAFLAACASGALPSPARRSFWHRFPWGDP
jgi:hypothetical protein